MKMAKRIDASVYSAVRIYTISLWLAALMMCLVSCKEADEMQAPVVVPVVTTAPVLSDVSSVLSMSDTYLSYEITSAMTEVVELL